MKKESLLKHLRHADLWLLLCAALLLLVLIVRELCGHFRFEALMRTLLLIINCMLFYLGGILYCKRTRSNRIMKHLFLLFFLLYLYLILSLTLLDPSLGRGAGSVYDQIGGRRELYLQYFVNLVPFHSIYNVYIRGFLGGYVNAYYTLLNLAGNICAFIPLAFFLPYFFRAQKRWYCFLPTVLLFTVAVELLQFVLMVGSCDIDDLLLNAGGAFLFYLLLKLPPLQKLLKLLTCETEGRIEPRD